MTVVKNIDVVMGAQTAEVDAAIAKEIQNLGRLERAVKESSGASEAFAAIGARIKGAFSPAAIAIGAAGIATASFVAGTMAIKNQLTEIDKVSDAAQKLGLRYSELKTLQAGLGESSGLEAQAIADAVAKLQVGLASAKNEPGGKMGKALSRAGIDAEGLLGKSTVDQFSEISKAIKALKTDAEQLELATKLFGRNGAALVVALRDGPEQLQKMAQFLDDVGANLTDIQVAAVGLANDAFGRLNVATEAWSQQLASQIAPAMTAIADDMTRMITGAKDAGSVMQELGDFTANTYGLIKDGAELMPANLAANLGKALYKNDGGLMGGINAIGDVLARAFDDDQALGLLEATYKVREEAEKVAKAAEETRRIRAAAREKEEEIAELTEKQRKEEEKQQKAIEKIAKSKDDMLRALKEEVDLYEAANEARMNGAKFDEKAFKEKQKLENLGGGGIDLQLERLQKQRAEQEKIKKALDDAKRIKDQTKSGDDQLKTELKLLNELKDKGLITQRQFDLAAKKKASETANPALNYGAVSAQAGSVEAYKLLLNRENEAKKRAEEKMRIDELNNRVLQEIAANTRNSQKVSARR